MKDIVQAAKEWKRALVPANRVRQDDGQVVVRIEMPGVTQRDLEIEVEGRQLTIVGRRQDPAVEGTWLLRERARGDFRRTYTVDHGIDLDKIDAHLQDGVLTLTLPMREEARPRKIEVRSA